MAGRDMKAWGATGGKNLGARSPRSSGVADQVHRADQEPPRHQSNLSLGLRSLLGETPAAPRFPKSNPNSPRGEHQRTRAPSKGGARPPSPRFRKRSDPGQATKDPRRSGGDDPHDHGRASGIVWSNIVASIHRGSADFIGNADFFKDEGKGNVVQEGHWSNPEAFVEELQTVPGLSEIREQLLLRLFLARSQGPQDMAEQQQEAQAEIHNFINDVFRKAWDVVDSTVQKKRAELEDEVRRAVHQHYKKQADSVHRLIAARDHLQGELEGTMEAIDNKMFVPLQRLDECHRVLISACVESIIKSTFQDAIQGKQTLVHGWLRQLMAKERSSISDSHERVLEQLTAARDEVSKLEAKYVLMSTTCEKLERDSLRLQEVQSLARASMTRKLRKSIRSGTFDGADKQWSTLLASIANIDSETEEEESDNEAEEEQEACEKAQETPADQKEEQEVQALDTGEERNPDPQVIEYHVEVLDEQAPQTVGEQPHEQEQPSSETSICEPPDQAQWLPSYVQESAARCRCGNVFMVDAAFCRKCGSRRQDVMVEAFEMPELVGETETSSADGHEDNRNLIDIDMDDSLDDLPPMLQQISSGSSEASRERSEEHCMDELVEEDREETPYSSTEQGEEQPPIQEESTKFCTHCGRSLEANFQPSEDKEQSSNAFSETRSRLDCLRYMQSRPALPGTTATSLMAQAMDLYDNLGQPWQFCQCAELLRALESVDDQLDREVEEEAIAVHMSAELPPSVSLLAARLQTVRREGTVLRSVCTALVATVGKLFEIACTKATVQLRLGMMERQLYEIIVTCRPRLLQCFTKAQEGWGRLVEPRLAARAAAIRPGSGCSDIGPGRCTPSDGLQPTQRRQLVSPGERCTSNDNMGSAESLWGFSDNYEAFAIDAQLTGQQSPSNVRKVDFPGSAPQARAQHPSPDQTPRRRRGSLELQGSRESSPRHDDASPRQPNSQSKSRSHSPACRSPSSPSTSIPPRWRSAADYGNTNLSPKPFLPYCSMKSSLGHGETPARPQSESAKRATPPPQWSSERVFDNEVAKVRRQLFLPLASGGTRATSAAGKQDASSSPPNSRILPPTCPHPLRREVAPLPVSTRLRRVHVS